MIHRTRLGEQHERGKHENKDVKMTSQILAMRSDLTVVFPYTLVSETQLGR